MSYSHLCLCAVCSAETLIRLGLPALSPREFVARAELHKLNDVQQRRVDAVKLMMWNDNAKGNNE